MWELEKLPWLAAPPDDFRVRCRTLGRTPGLLHNAAGVEAAALAQGSLDGNQLTHLASAVARLQEAGTDLKPLLPFRLGIVANATVCHMTPALVASALRYGIALEIVVAPYDQAMQEALDPAGTINGADLNGVLLALDYRGMPLMHRADLASAAAGSEMPRPDRALAFLDGVRSGLQRHCRAPVILQTIVPPAEPEFGSYDRLSPDGMDSQIERLNDRLVAMAGQHGDLIFDLARLAERVGLDRWHDPMRWHLNKLPFTAAAIPLYADHLGRLLGAMRGRYRKCLVLDLDNTIWGGVVGDDGVGSLILGQGSGLGEAFLAVQRMALDLKARGIVLAVCSRNDEEVARQPFREHPDMLLREADIAVFKAGWGEKAEALAEIATALNFSPEALVLLDDNPVERARVRQLLPMVAVPELPADPSLYPRALLSAGYFEAIGFSTEDRDRADHYAADAQRQVLQADSHDMTDFLRSLDMTLEVGPFDPLSAPRVAQLINKSNQYNLTTRRYSEAEVRALIGRRSVQTLQARLRDRFGDNGIVSVVICRETEGPEWQIDTWLMSCRVLGRRVEDAIRDHLALLARARGATALVGRFAPSGRNDLVRDHYARLGFSAAGEAGEDRLWRLPLAEHAASELPLRILGRHDA